MQDMPIGERIRLYRRRRGLSQPRLAQLIGRSESWLSQVERGVRSVDRFSTIIELARVLRVQVVDLTGRPLSLAPNGGAHLEAVDALRRALMSYSAIPAALDMDEEPGRRPDLARLRRTVVMANELYQAGSYSGAGSCCRALSRTRRKPLGSCEVMTAGRRSGSWPRPTTSRPSP